MKARHKQTLYLHRVSGHLSLAVSFKARENKRRVSDD